MTEPEEREEKFFNAVAQGRLALVREMAVAEPALLSLGRADERGVRDKTALHMAAMASNHKMADLLIGLGAPVEALDRFGLPPLMLAAQFKDMEMAQKLVNAGADPLFRTQDGITAVMFAAQGGAVDILKYFLGLGVEVNGRRDCGMTALHFARHAENAFETVNCLITAGADAALQNVAGENPAQFAAKLGNKAYGDIIDSALKLKDIRAKAKAVTDRQDREVLENGLPEAFSVRRSPLRFAVKS